MLSGATTVGLLGLITLGVWQVSRRYLTASARGRTLGSGPGVSRARDHRDDLVFPDAGAGLNLIVLGVEILAVAVGIVTAAVVVAHPQVPPRRKAFISLALGLGVVLIGDAIAIRLGLRESTREEGRPLATATTPAVARTYANLENALSTARGGGLDQVTVGVLAAATEGEDVRGIAEWSERVGVGDRQEVYARVDELVAAGLVEERNGRLRVGDVLADAEPEQIATAAESVLK
jgi:hypothetical protein